MPTFEQKARDGLARIGRLSTAHGSVETPALLPVIHPGQMIIPPAQMKKLFGTEMVITNSYIIRGRDEFRERALKEGVHSLIGFDGPVMTDSGTFQSYVYGDVDVTQTEILDFQRAIGSDFCTMLDIFSTPDTPRERAAAELVRNIERAREASAHFYNGNIGRTDDPKKKDQGLVLTVQGGVFPELREESAKAVAGLECGLQAIGGVVPLMESYRFTELVDVVLAARKRVDPSRPIHLFGAGHPMMFALGALMGCDMFDSASYVKMAKDDRLMFLDGTRSLQDLDYLPCSCPVCSGTTPQRLRKLPPEDKVRSLAEHNLHVSFTELRTVRQAIMDGTLWELVEERCRAHPELLSALAQLGEHAEYLERFAPLSRHGAFFYKGAESSFRPEVLRWSRRISERYGMPSPDLMVCFPDCPRPYSRHLLHTASKILERHDARFVVTSFFGPVPLELDGMYPIAQSMIPARLDPLAKDRINGQMKRFSHSLKSRLSIIWEGEKSFEALELMTGPKEGTGSEKETARMPQPSLGPDWDMNVVRLSADMQFGSGAADALLAGRVELVTSPNTGRVRNVMADGRHILSLRATDGFFSLKIAGAERLLKAFPSPRFRVIVENEPASFAAEGKNVFSRFVKDADPALRPMEEVIVVDERGGLAAVGRALLVRDEMLAFKRGIAVKVRDGFKKPAAPDAEE
jgi:7-cyano-7-deazaguanine tRNA-ribosyltransferase